MLLTDLQTRLNLILPALDAEIPDDGFRVLAADQSEQGINLSSGEGQQELERHLDGVDLLIAARRVTLTRDTASDPKFDVEIAADRAARSNSRHNSKESLVLRRGKGEGS
jgi:hypothetical protein